MLALDVSRSMTATDVQPSRLGAAQAAARRFLARVPDTFRVAVVAFADRANVVAPATDDRRVVQQALAQSEAGEERRSERRSRSRSARRARFPARRTAPPRRPPPCC